MQRPRRPSSTSANKAAATPAPPSRPSTNYLSRTPHPAGWSFASKAATSPSFPISSTSCGLSLRTASDTSWSPALPALGAAAYAGIPLTARGYSTAVRLLTAYRADLLDDPYWNELAQTEDTLVFYMSSDPADQLVSRLLENGIPEDRWITVIEQATTPHQQISNYPIREYFAATAGRSWQSPCLIIIGKVGALQPGFGWLPDTISTSLYFPPIEPKISKKTLLC